MPICMAWLVCNDIAVMSSSSLSETIVVLISTMMSKQVELHKSGRRHEIVQETRLFDESKSETFTMRRKEGGSANSKGESCVAGV